MVVIFKRLFLHCPRGVITCGKTLERHNHAGVTRLGMQWLDRHLSTGQFANRRPTRPPPLRALAIKFRRITSPESDAGRTRTHPVVIGGAEAATPSCVCQPWLDARGRELP